MGETQGLCILLTEKPSRTGFGFFRYARELTEQENPPAPLRHIFSLMRMQKCSFMVEEELQPNERCLRQMDITQGISLLGNYRRRVIRLTFFKCNKPDGPFKSKTRDEALRNCEKDWHSFRQLLKEPGSDLKCLGFLYLYTDYAGKSPRHSHVHAAVIATDNLESPNKYIHSSPLYAGRVHNDFWFPVVGSYFAQQDTFLSCCYHTALMVCLKNIYAALNLPCIASYELMNEIARVDCHKRRSNEPLSLSPAKALDILGELLPFRHEAIATNRLCVPNDVIASAYHSVEAALPSVIYFYEDLINDNPMGMGHAMAVVGHTFEAGLWQYRKHDLRHCEWPAYHKQHYHHCPSHLWAEGLVIQDEASGPYCTLPWHALIDRYPGVIIPRLNWTIKSYPQEAEIAAERILNPGVKAHSDFFQSILDSDAAPASKDANGWFFEVKRHVEASKDQLCFRAIRSHVLRTVPCTPRSYLKFLRDLASPDLCQTVKRDLGESPFWLVEISVPHLFQWNNERLGEVVVPVSTSPCDSVTVYLVRLPGVLTLFEEDGSCRHHKISGDYHYPLTTQESMPLKELLTAR